MLKSNDSSIAALLVLTGTPSDLDGLTSLLDAPDPATRATIADAMLRRGRRADLLARSDDAVLYPYALKAASTDGTENIRRVLALAPPTEALAAEWMDTVAALAGSAPPNRILELDDLVGATSHASDTLRTRLLISAIADRELDGNLHRRILKRLIPMLLEQDAAASALTYIRDLDEDSMDDELRSLQFISAIRAREYDDAAEMQPDPVMWALAYEDTLASRPDSAPDLRNEIVRRFNEQMTPELRTRLGLVDDPLMQPEDDPAPETDVPEESETTP